MADRNNFLSFRHYLPLSSQLRNKEFMEIKRNSEMLLKIHKSTLRVCGAGIYDNPFNEISIKHKKSIEMRSIKLIPDMKLHFPWLASMWFLLPIFVLRLLLLLAFAIILSLALCGAGGAGRGGRALGTGGWTSVAASRARDQGWKRPQYPPSRAPPV